MAQGYNQGKKACRPGTSNHAFMKQKMVGKWFIDGSNNDKHVATDKSSAISDFFLTGDETKLKPMILKDVAERTDSTYPLLLQKIRTNEYGRLSAQIFFSKPSKQGGKNVSSHEVKHILKKASAKIPQTLYRRSAHAYSIKKDTKLRRTVAKYREQMNIPVARLRKNLVLLKNHFTKIVI